MKAHTDEIYCKHLHLIKSGRVTLDCPHCKIEQLLESLTELMQWMLENTGPKDGTLEMLTRAQAAIVKAQGE